MPDVYLYSGEANPADVKLTDPTLPASGSTYNVNLTEALTTQDSVLGVLVTVSDLTEPLTSSESEVVTLVAAGLLTEPLAASESSVSVFVAQSALTESLAAGESETVAFTALGNVTEPLTSSESSSGFFSTNASRDESISVSNSEAASLVTNGSLTEALSITDAEIASADLAAARTEPLASTGQPAGTIDTVAAVAEAITATDAPSSAFNDEVVETLTADEFSVADVSAPVPEPVSNAGGYIPFIQVNRRARRVRAGELRESVRAYDSTVCFTVARGTVADVLSVKAAQFAALVTGARVTEALDARESASATVGRPSGVTESLAASSTQECSATFAGRAAEPLKAADGVSAEVVPWILERMKFDGITLHVHSNLSISIVADPGVEIDLTVSRGKATGTVTLPLDEILSSKT